MSLFDYACGIINIDIARRETKTDFISTRVRTEACNDTHKHDIEEGTCNMEQSNLYKVLAMGTTQICTIETGHTRHQDSRHPLQNPSHRSPRGVDRHSPDINA